MKGKYLYLFQYIKLDIIGTFYDLRSFKQKAFLICMHMYILQSRVSTS